MKRRDFIKLLVAGIATASIAKMPDLPVKNIKSPKYLTATEIIERRGRLVDDYNSRQPWVELWEAIYQFIEPEHQYKRISDFL